MSTCDDDKLDRELPEIPSGAELPAGQSIDAAILVTDPTKEYPLTAVAERDVHSAITHGLGSYLAQLRRSHAGRDVRLESVIADWPDHEDGSRAMPSAAVHSEETAAYEDVKPSRPLVLDDSSPTQALTIVSTAMYRLNELTVDVYCSDKVQREGVRRMLEDAANPVDWMGGFRLVLPSYHNAIAEFTPLSCQFLDGDLTVMQGLRVMQMKFAAWCQVYRLHRMPLARPQTRGTIRARGA